MGFSFLNHPAVGDPRLIWLCLEAVLIRSVLYGKSAGSKVGVPDTQQAREGNPVATENDFGMTFKMFFFINGGTPKIVGLYWKIPFKRMIWEYPYFKKPPNASCFLENVGYRFAVGICWHICNFFCVTL